MASEIRSTRCGQELEEHRLLRAEPPDMPSSARVIAVACFLGRLVSSAAAGIEHPWVPSATTFITAELNTPIARALTCGSRRAGACLSAINPNTQLADGPPVSRSAIFQLPIGDRVGLDRPSISGRLVSENPLGRAWPA